MMRPGDVTIETPAPRAWWPEIWTWMQQWPRLNFDDSGPRTYAEFEAHREARAAAGERSWGVRFRGAPCGVVWYVPATPRLGQLHVCFAQRVWGRGVPMACVAPIADALIASGVEKVVGLMFADNAAAQHYAERLGFTQEGLCREHVVRDGEAVDVRLMAMTRAAWREQEAARG